MCCIFFFFLAFFLFFWFPLIVLYASNVYLVYGYFTDRIVDFIKDWSEDTDTDSVILL